jgi:hypothetical protein
MTARRWWKSSHCSRRDTGSFRRGFDVPAEIVLAVLAFSLKVVLAISTFPADIAMGPFLLLTQELHHRTMAKKRTRSNGNNTPNAQKILKQTGSKTHHARKKNSSGPNAPRFRINGSVLVRRSSGDARGKVTLVESDGDGGPVRGALLLCLSLFHHSGSAVPPH